MNRRVRLHPTRETALLGWECAAVSVSSISVHHYYCRSFYNKVMDRRVRLHPTRETALLTWWIWPTVAIEIKNRNLSLSRAAHCSNTSVICRVLPAVPSSGQSCHRAVQSWYFMRKGHLGIFDKHIYVAHFTTRRYMARNLPCSSAILHCISRAPWHINVGFSVAWCW